MPSENGGYLKRWTSDGMEYSDEIAVELMWFFLTNRSESAVSIGCAAEGPGSRARGGAGGISS